MKKQILLFRRKGFTLIECLIAIAVFGAMTMIVFMILTHARTQTVEANKSEEDLSNLIENVIGDETYKRYNEANHTGGNDTLQLNVQGVSDAFSITYNVVDGNKNLIKCSDTNCGYYGNNTEFMFAADGSVVPKASFVQTSEYKCPKCGVEFEDTLTCEDCEATGKHTDTSLFTYLPSTAGYMCNTCGGLAVHHDSYAADATGDATMSISGIVPNAMRYGEVKDKADSGRTIQDLVYYTNTATGGGKINFGLSYQASSNGNLPGEYTLSVSAADVPADAIDTSGSFTMVINLPPYYVVKDFKQVTGSGSATPVVLSGDTKNHGSITITTAMKNSVSTYTFQLVNYRSGFTFENDYFDASDKNNTGLGGYWFGASPNVTLADDNKYVESSTFSKTVDCKDLTTPTP